MRTNWRHFSIFLLSLMGVLILSEIAISSLLPALGIFYFRPPIHILFVFYFAWNFKNLTPLLVFLVQFVHGLFTVEHWSYGTFIGLLLGHVLHYLKDMLDFTHYVTKAFVVLGFFIIWHAILFVIYSFKLPHFELTMDHFLSLSMEFSLLSFMAPFLFDLFNYYWRRNLPQQGVEV